MELCPHPLAASMPLMRPDQYAALVSDVRANGLREAITLFEGRILDGRHRYRACLEIGVEPITREFSGSLEQAAAYVESLNVKRRHLTQEQQRERIRAELARDPAQSDRSIAKKVGVSHPTVAVERDLAAPNGKTFHKPDRKEANGRKARGRKPA